MDADPDSYLSSLSRLIDQGKETIVAIGECGLGEELLPMNRHLERRLTAWLIRQTMIACTSLLLNRNANTSPPSSPSPEFIAFHCSYTHVQHTTTLSESCEIIKPTGNPKAESFTHLPARSRR